ncbi:YfjI family protein [Plantactinospora sp. WMMB334]|uniref:YfjI family protein n=1 Tax=Plantactinospora sp. WMMB334 TaxID=3404119 RepID=UPI003B92D24E
MTAPAASRAPHKAGAHINDPYDPWEIDKDFQREVRRGRDGRTRTAERWPDPEPLGSPGYGKPGPYPVEAVPTAFRDMIEAVAANKQVPAELPALMGQAAAAALAAPRLAIECEPGWVEPLNLYAACGLEPGSLKSPATNDVIQEVRRLHKVLRASHADEISERRKDLRRQIAEARERKADKKAGEEEKATAAALVRDLDVEIKELDDVVSPRILMPADSTPEVLTRNMSVNGEHGAILDSEGTFFSILLGRYTGGVPNLDSVLKSYDGDYVEVSRISREQRDMTRAILTLGLAVQPMILEDAAKSRAMIEQGLLGRFYLAVPESRIGYRNRRGAPYNPTALAAWDACLRKIANLSVADPDTPKYQFPRLFLTDQAREAFFDFKDKIEVSLRPDGDLGDLRGWGAKHAGRTLRLSGLLHLIGGGAPDEPVNLAAMESAVQVGNWAIPHAVAVFGMEDESPRAEDEHAIALLQWIQTKAPKVISLNEINRHCRQAWVKKGKKAAIVPVVDRLVETGWLRPVETTDKGGRPAIVYDRHERVTREGPLW